MFLLQSATLHDTAAAESGTSGAIKYTMTKEHPVLRYLPTKWAEFIGDNLWEELRLPGGLKQQGQWNVQGLNFILSNCLASPILKVFGAIEWESEMCKGKPKARCFPFKSHQFNGKIVQVNFQSCYYTFNVIFQLSKFDFNFQSYFLTFKVLYF